MEDCDFGLGLSGKKIENVLDNIVRSKVCFREFLNFIHCIFQTEYRIRKMIRYFIHAHLDPVGSLNVVYSIPEDRLDTVTGFRGSSIRSHTSIPLALWARATFADAWMALTQPCVVVKAMIWKCRRGYGNHYTTSSHTTCGCEGGNRRRRYCRDYYFSTVEG